MLTNEKYLTLTLLGIITGKFLTGKNMADFSKTRHIIPVAYLLVGNQPFIFKIQKLRIFSVSDVNFPSWDYHDWFILIATIWNRSITIDH